jgi:hypothetical protein
MKKQYEIGDLVESLFANYGFGIIIQTKNYGAHANAYQIRWSNNHSTWEPARQLLLKAKAK